MLLHLLLDGSIDDVVFPIQTSFPPLFWNLPMVPSVSPRCCFLVLLVGLAAPVACFRASSPAAQSAGLFGGRGRVLLKHQHHPRLSQTAHQSAALATLDAFFQSQPYAAAALTCGFKASTADLVAQNRDYRKRNEKRIEKMGADAAAPKKTTDLKRNLAFVIYGALYQGASQEFIYNHIYPTLFGSGTGVVVVLSKVVFDLCIQTTLVTLPIAYLTKALIYKYSAQEAMQRYWDDIRNHGLLKKYFLLWGPVQCITFSIVPEHYRVTFIACVSFFWLIILSSIASKAPKKIVKAPVVEEEDEEDIPECEFTDGLTCSIDG